MDSSHRSASAAGGGIWLEPLTWLEADVSMRSFDTVMIPIGARCKEHGPHLPLNTDWLIAEYLARRVVEECRVIVVPTLQYGYYPAFLEYPGSVSIGESTFTELIVDVCRSFSKHALRKVYALNTGISTLPSLAVAQSTLAGEGVRLEYTDLRCAGAAARASIEQQPRGTHADEIETSVMMYIAPEVVRLHLAQPELAEERPGPLRRDSTSATGVFSATGSWGDPTLATEEKGRLVTEAIVADIVAFLRREFAV